ncbi:MAG: hypothetical protein M1121_01110 [Actinobacteria bacterium]|nr:hypothetical protein [Actinomycetota bacterium]
MHLVPACDATAATVGQIRVLTVLLAKDREISLFVFDVGHDAIALGQNSPASGSRCFGGSGTTGCSTTTRLPARTGSLRVQRGSNRKLSRGSKNR